MSEEIQEAMMRKMDIRKKKQEIYPKSDHSIETSINRKATMEKTTA